MQLHAWWRVGEREELKCGNNDEENKIDCFLIVERKMCKGKMVQTRDERRKWRENLNYQ